MGIQSQAGYAGTPLSKFLDRHLPNRDGIVQEWFQKVENSPRPDVRLTDGRDDVGWAIELCIELDLASTPPRLPELAFLPPEKCAALLTAAGFARPETWRSNHTTDPVLQRWERSRNPIAIDDNQRLIFSTSLELASVREPMHRWKRRHTVEYRRGLFDAAMSLDEGNPGGQVEHFGALTHCWDAYLDRGRRALSTLGEKTTVAPEFASGYGIADLVIGRALVEIKLGVESTSEHVGTWLKQLLGYVLLDRYDTFHFDTIAVYHAWTGRLLTVSLTGLLDAASAVPPVSLSDLRHEFYQALRDEIDGYVAWRERERYR